MVVAVFMAVAEEIAELLFLRCRDQVGFYVDGTFVFGEGGREGKDSGFCDR